MFQNLKKGSSVYVLDLREVPKFYTATVKEVGTPYYPQPTPGQMNPFMQQYVNISLDNGESWGVRANMDVESKNGITVSMTRDGLMPILTAANKESLDVINSVDRHRGNLKAYEQILKELDPGYAKAKEQDEEIKRLSSELASMKEILKTLPGEIKGMLKSETTKTTKQ